MRALLLALLVVGLLVAGCGDSAAAGVLDPSAGVERSEVDSGAPIAELATGFNNAGFELWRFEKSEENMVFSPMSIGHALLMARAAADDVTGAAIDAALDLPDGVAAHQAWNAIDSILARHTADEDEITLTIADRIWPRRDISPDQGWVDVLTAEHGVSVEPLDFAGDPAASRETINDWVAERTEQLIPELLPEGFLDPNTVLVLTDAVYFAARWQRVFGKYGPVAGEFTRLDGTEVPVEFMRELELGQYPHGRLDDFVFAEIPYIGGDFSMLIIVPDGGSFTTVRDGLEQDSLDAIDAAAIAGPYELLVPQWTTTTALNLMPWLDSIGASPGSYPAIAPDAFLDAAVHGADIAVDDQGTVAAAATALGFPESGPPDPEMTVKADRPFLYVIRNRFTGIVLFAGQVTDPTS